MSARRGGTSGAVADWRHLVAVGGLLLAVGGTLILGLVLEVDPETPAAAEGPAARPAIAESSPPPSPSPVLETLPPRESVSPARRAEEDRPRLAAQRGRFTQQIVMACDPDTVRPLLRELAAEDSLFLAPMRYRGRDCYRVCWGLYDSLEEARVARDLPAVLAAIEDPPQPKPVDRLLE